MNVNYNTEIKNILNNIYKHKIYEIALKNNMTDLKKDNIDSYLNTFKETKIYLGSDMDEFIIKQIPKEKDGYLFRCAIANSKNYSYPRLYDYLGNKINNTNSNKFAIQLWEAHMNEFLIEDIQSNFNQNDYIKFIDDNFENLIDDILIYVQDKVNKKEIIIPFKNKDDLLNVVKSMLLNNELDFSFAESLIDIDLLRDEMTKFAATFHMYNEFDKIEDNLEYCLDNFCKFNSSSLFEFLTNKKGFNFVEGIGLVYK